MASVITITGEQLFAAKAQANEQLDIDTFIFANVPNQNPNAPINREEGIPTAHIVYQQNVQQVGRINDNVVVYSTVLDSITGPFEFNWVGLYSSVNQKLVAINHVPTVTKTATAPGAAGNTLNRNFGIEYSGIAELTGITVEPETWQLDFTARLSGMDKLTQQLATDMNGKDWFIDDGLKVVPRATANSFSVTPGVGYVSGLRVELKQEHILIVQSYPQFVYVDAWFSGNANSTWSPQLAFTVTNTEMDDYIDPSGTQHYVYKLAVINAADDVEDLRVGSEQIDVIKKTAGAQYSSVEAMILASKPPSLGMICRTGGTTWIRVANTGTGNISDFTAIGDVFATDFDTFADLGAKVNAALLAAKSSSVYVPAGEYSWSTQLSSAAASGGKRVYGEYRNTVINLAKNAKIFDTQGDFKLNNITIALSNLQTVTPIKFDWVSGARQANTSDLSGTMILGNAADCVGAHIKCSGTAYMAYNNWDNFAVVNEGVKKGGLLLEVEGTSYIQGNAFTNLNLVRSGVKYITDGVERNVKNLKGNTFTGTYQTKTGANERFEYSGINMAWSWDSAGFANLDFLQDSITLTGGITFYELNGDNRWNVTTPNISVIDGWGEYVRNYNSIAAGCQTLIKNSTSKAQRGFIKIVDPCVNKLDSRFDLVGVNQEGIVSTISGHSRCGVKITNKAALAEPAKVKLSNSACTINKFPRLVFAAQKVIEGFYGSGTPQAWNRSCDVDIGLISSDHQNGIYVKIVATGDAQTSTVSIVSKVDGLEELHYSEMTLLQHETIYITIETTNINVTVKVTKTNANKHAGVILAENPTVGITSGDIIINRSSLFDQSLTLLDPVINYTNNEKVGLKGSYNVFGIEYTQTDL
ncbi:phage tail protein [Shewanella xiamenensis]|uniref:phage tail protein n=1 Tax=Shewanella xiamenensis TaxID=332186 RepID=UPI00217DB689|nr:phage tail protein [Shewanella xiamenensis]MCT8858358.1 phage tail protein [Shewanella xiamenensis]UWG65903.1 phage tail protein [Shewanella xiamenensis]